MLRNEWEFEYTAAKLADAAQDQRDFRALRVEEWTAKKAEVMQRIRDSGISISESLADQLYAGKMSSHSQYNRGPQIVIDATMQTDLNECMDRIRHHTALRDQYAAWTQVLMANHESRLRLHHDDWTFFFGKANYDEANEED